MSASQQLIQSFSKKVRSGVMTVLLDSEEIQLLEACCLFEPWLVENIRRARKTRPGGDFPVVLTWEERLDVLSALEAHAYFAKEDKDDERSIDFSVLHDKIIFFTPDDFEYEHDSPEDEWDDEGVFRKAKSNIMKRMKRRQAQRL